MMCGPGREKWEKLSLWYSIQLSSKCIIESNKKEDVVLDQCPR